MWRSNAPPLGACVMMPTEGKEPLEYDESESGEDDEDEGPFDWFLGPIGRFLKMIFLAGKDEFGNPVLSASAVGPRPTTTQATPPPQISTIKLATG
mmetsp:Transcript_39766/g.55223  ORF Transcript_39766/g.55223 Transcript_39766/m.55223 type:complete len:96 (+) Transcript_39766:127-414(+)